MQCPPLLPCPRVIGCTSTSSSSLPQSFTFQSLPWLWPSPLSWPSELYALHDKPLLPLTNKAETVAPPHVITIFHSAAP